VRASGPGKWGNRVWARFDPSTTKKADGTPKIAPAFDVAVPAYKIPAAAPQSGATQVVTADAAGNLATSTLAGLGIASAGDIGAINARLDNLTAQSNKAMTGVAMAFAMAGVPTLMPHERFAVTMNWGNFQSANGLALNAAVRLDERVQFNAGVGYGANQNIVGGRAGLRFGW